MQNTNDVYSVGGGASIGVNLCELGQLVSEFDSLRVSLTVILVSMQAVCK